MYIVLVNAATDKVQGSLHLLSRRFGASKTGEEKPIKSTFTGNAYSVSAREILRWSLSLLASWLRDITF